MTNIDFPFHFDATGRTASTDYNNHIKNMVLQLLLTGTGERVNRPDFGSGLLQMVFEPNSPELAATLKFTAQSSLQKWLGDIIEIQNLDVQSVDSSLTVTVVYIVLKTGEQRTETFEGINA